MAGQIIFDAHKVEEFSPRNVVNFIVFEEPSPNGVTREAVALDDKIHTGLQIGDFVKADGSKVVFADPKAPTANELKSAVGISLSSLSATNLFSGKLSNQGEPWIVYLKASDGLCKITIKDTLLSDYLGISIRNAKGEWVIPAAIAAWLEASCIDIVETGY